MNPPRASARAKVTQLRSAVGIRDGAIDLGNKRIPLLSGAMHYWRLDPSVWSTGLQELRNLGFPIVETYIPWGVHETAPGEFDFGTTDPRRDLKKFLELAHEAGLYVFLRPGPHINAELTYFGLPERIVYDKACQARSPEGHPVILPFPPVMFPVPSYASDAFHEETGKWFDAVGEVVKPFLYPQGPVVLLQVDNEAAFYFRNGPYCQDYHPDAVAAWHAFLERKYHTLEAVAHAHRRTEQAWTDIAPPKSFEAKNADDLTLHLDWAAFQESVLTDALVRMKKRMADAGLAGVPTVHNVPLGDGGLPVNIADMSRHIDIVGLDYYHSRREYRTVKRRTLALSGTVSLPYAPELGVGAPPWFTPLSHDDSLFTAMTALAFGVRGFNLYMAVDRDRWYGAPIDASGMPRVEAGSWKHLLHQLQAVEFHKLQRRVDVGLLMPREYGRLARATHLLGPISPSILEAVGNTPVDACRDDAFGFAGPIQSLWWRMLGRFADALTKAGVPYVYVDSDADSVRTAVLRTLIVPSYEFASPASWKKTCAFAADGGRVVFGPTMPRLDETFHRHPFEVPRDAKHVFIDTPQDAEQVVRDLIGELSLEAPFFSQTPGIETAVHEDGHGPRVLFVVNPTSTSQRAMISLPYAMSFRDAMTDETMAGAETLEIHVPRRHIRMLIVEQRSATHADAQVMGIRARARRSR